MKFTIFGFSQNKLVEYGLDTNDAMILRWLVDFAATGKMKKTIENKEVYYLVQYEAVIKEFPVMGINSIKAITNRFEKYVKNGLLKRLVKRGGSGRGCVSCYALTELITEMMYENNQNISIISSSEKAEITTSESKASNVSDSNQTSYREYLNPDSNLNSYRGKTFSDSNETSYRESQNTPDRNQTSHRQEPNFSSTGTKLPVGIYNQSINSSLKNSSSSSKQEELKKYLNYYVDTHNFSSDFIPALLNKLDEFSILQSEYKDFCDYAYKTCSSKIKDQQKLMSYMYATIPDNYFVSGYIQHKKKQAENKILHNIKCPVCQTEHIRYSPCPVCELKDPNSEIEIKFRQSIYSLPEEKKAELNQELKTLFDSNESPAIRIINYKKNRELIYQKYCNFTHEDFASIFDA